jgi:hypothetical protein
MIPNKIVTNHDVLCVGVLHWVVGDLYCTFIITQEQHFLGNNIIIQQGLLHPKQLSATTTGGDVLRFGGGTGNIVLFLGGPTN